MDHLDLAPIRTKTDQIESGDTRRIALWMLDPDYYSGGLFPRQVFFPMAAERGGWARLACNLKADPDRIEAYRGTVDPSIESLKIISLP